MTETEKFLRRLDKGVDTGGVKLPYNAETARWVRGLGVPAYAPLVLDEHSIVEETPTGRTIRYSNWEGHGS